MPSCVREYTWWLHKNVQQLIFTWDDSMTVVTGTLLQSKSWFLPRCLTDWRFDKNYSLGMTGGEMFRLIVITGMNQLPSSGSLKEKHSMKHCNQFMRALEGNKAKVNHYCWLLPTFSAGPESLNSLPPPACWNSLVNSLTEPTEPTQIRDLEDFPESKGLNDQS